MPDVVIGGLEKEHVKITVLRRAYPQAEDYWDGNWVRARIDVQVGAWRGTYPADLRVEEFIDFRRELEIVYSTLQGTASFASLEPWLNLTFSMDRLGNISIKGRAADAAVSGGGGVLDFTLPEIDQSYLPALISQLHEIEHEIPLRGRPEE